ncbi:methylated-DNA--[protein]-cysteine S-methyltransferase [Paenibacillus tyrfis]|uniref:MGMT family protein n=1 Tax=Paenibacillus TaxID=44249 RepID=UPI001C1F2653|nr:MULTISPECIES: MGMT family protein [Paenibacillus]MBU7319984.1 MGMT family protein [Paenibacillus oleatilyticus]GLI04735.1 methylated-DNA--[protein]-cysteine S-methyltransferase [Paenibacillus tyrfis]GMX62774.1 MGMT family protein [Paenibacillus elgii]
MNPFSQRVIEIIQGIPEGYVMTYGQIAGLAGSPRGARQVVRILHSSSGKHGLPWHRVVNARGEIGIQQEEGRMLQMLYLRGEGVEVADNGQLDLDRWRFIPLDE